MAIIKLTHKGLSMKKTTVSIFGIVAMTAGLWATVPYTFTPNTPAKASEVNANFQALSDKVSILESNVTTNSEAIEKESSDCWKSPYTYTYTYTPSSIGDTVMVGGKDYIMVAMPFIEHGTGDHYYVKYPKEKQGYISSKTMSVYTTISTRYVKPGDSCFTHTFAGFPANDYTAIYYDNRYTAIMEDPADSRSTYRVNSSAGGGVSVKINQTILWFNVDGFQKKIQESQLSSGDVDMSDNLNWSDMANDISLVDNVKTLMNYVEIVKMP